MALFMPQSSLDWHSICPPQFQSLNLYLKVTNGAGWAMLLSGYQHRMGVRRSTLSALAGYATLGSFLNSC